MAVDRKGAGLAALRVLIGVFFVSEGLIKLEWFTDSSLLMERFAGYLQAVGPDSVTGWYLQAIAMPGAALFAWLVPLGELGCGLALMMGVRTTLAASVALFMTLNFHIASGAIFDVGFLTNGYGLPVMGALLGLAIGGVRLPFSLPILRE